MGKTGTATYTVTLDRRDGHVSTARARTAVLTVESGSGAEGDTFNPAELLLAAVGACMLKNIERVAPILKFGFRGVHVEIQGERRDVPPGYETITYAVHVDTDEDDRRLQLLHRNVRQYGTVFNTVAAGTRLSGTLSRGPVHATAPGHADGES